MVPASGAYRLVRVSCAERQKTAVVGMLSQLDWVMLWLSGLIDNRLIWTEGMPRSQIETMLARARILACPTRLHLWFSLGSDGMRPGDVARMHGVAASTATYHLQMLEREKLVEVVGSGRRRVYRWTHNELVLATRAELEAAGLQ